MPQSFSILVIDDDESLTLTLPQAAKSSFSEATFTFVRNAHQAQAYFGQAGSLLPKLVLLDVNLNDTVDGLHLLSRLRADETLFILPVIIMTAAAKPPLVYEAYHKGATSFSQKPFSFSEWKTFLAGLRAYWYTTVSLPPVPRPKSGALPM